MRGLVLALICATPVCAQTTPDPAQLLQAAQRLSTQPNIALADVLDVLRPQFGAGTFYYHLGPDSLPDGIEDPFYWHSEGVIDTPANIATYYCSRAGRVLSQDQQALRQNDPLTLSYSPSAGPIPLTFWSDVNWPDDAIARMDCYFSVERWQGAPLFEGGVAIPYLDAVADTYSSRTDITQDGPYTQPQGYDWVVLRDARAPGAHIGYFEIAEHPDIFRIWLTGFLPAPIS
ncbi:hypothetical protein [Pseudooctadecabacter jejudonensis]|uniref:Uncharacterized protein n=1 Tax=Pseudooctadecabacter jejudonensis TaxID=1391910 RepID=A0A1Y5SR82_9RHOB|nr:hypothetical protein [Pseudooctadecabacter jejudonensis]SLN43406.1 hypothetical protein PSJ8397_02223 [Pseudooctadecabacter jejudonensis]